MADLAKPVNGTLKNGSSSNMAVNGSVTPQVFLYNPPSNADVDVASLCLIAETSNAIALGNKFIDTTIGTLANGLLIEGKADNVEFLLQTCKRTRDLVEIAAPGGLDIITGTPNLFHCHLWLPSSLRLVKQGIYPSDDYLRVTVRDDLRAITFMELFFQGVKL
jgi:hypothetical protein